MPGLISSLRLYNGRNIRQGKSRRPTYYALSSTKLGKERFNLAGALLWDRAAVGRRRSLSLGRSILKRLKNIHGSFLLFLWYFGPYLELMLCLILKNMQPDELSTLTNGREIPVELLQRDSPMSNFKHLSNTNNNKQL